MKIKICGLRDPANIRAIAALKPDMMGFIFYSKSPRFAHPESLKPAMALIPDGIQKVGVFVNEKVERVAQTASELGLDYVQLHGDETVEEVGFLKKTGLGTIKVFAVESEQDLARFDAYSEAVDYFLFDTKTAARGGSGKQFDWNIIYKYRFNKPFLLAGGIGAEVISQIATFSHQDFAGVDANSRLETSPGLKDIGLVSSFINDIRAL
ncbi:MAG: phosphoribosylanthranilate isomerase [Bacteroidia bacterium]